MSDEDAANADAVAESGAADAVAESGAADAVEESGAADADPGVSSTDGPADDPDRGEPSLPRRLLHALGLTLLALLLTEFLVFAAHQDDGYYRLVGALLLSELGFLLAASLYLRTSLVRPEWPLPGRADAAAAYRGLGPWIVLTGSVALAVLLLGAQAVARLAGVTFVPGAPAGDASAATGLLALLATSVLLAAPVEELFFRGVLQTHLRGASSASGAVVGAAALFALAHVPGHLATASAAGSAVATVAVFLAGLALGAAYERTGSLGVAIALHAGTNLLAVGTYVVVGAI